MAEQTHSPERQRELNAEHYLQAHHDANITSARPEHREIHKGTMKRLEEQDPGVVDRALFGTHRHTGRLNRNLREYQRGLQGLYSEDEIQAKRRELDRERAPRPPSRARGPASSSPPSRTRARGTFHRTITVPTQSGTGERSTREITIPRAAPTVRRVAREAGAPAAGNTVLKAIGALVGLSVLYLLLSPKGAGAFSGLLGTGTGVLNAILGPGDPLALHPFGGSSSSAPAPVTAAQRAGVQAALSPITNLSTPPFASSVSPSVHNTGRPARPPAK